MGKGKRVAVKAEEAIEFTQAELITLLQSTDKKLQTLLGTNDIKFDPLPKVVLGFVDRSDPLQIRTLFNEDNKIPVQDELIETDLMDLRRKCLNGATNAGAHSVLIEPAANSILCIYCASSLNLDAAAVNNSCALRTAGGTAAAYLWAVSNLAAGAIASAPHSSSGTSILHTMGLPSFILTDSFEYFNNTGSVAVSQDTNFYLLYSYIGDAPTITETGPVGAVWSNIA